MSFAKEEGLLDLSPLLTDGSTIKANASNKRVFTREELEVLLKFVDGEPEEWAKQDAIEGKAFGDLRGSKQLPQRSKKTIQKAVRYYLKKIKERGSVFKEDIQPHTTAGKDAGYLSIWRNDKIYRRTFDP